MGNRELAEPIPLFGSRIAETQVPRTALDRIPLGSAPLVAIVPGVPKTRYPTVEPSRIMVAGRPVVLDRSLETTAEVEAARAIAEVDVGGSLVPYTDGLTEARLNDDLAVPHARRTPDGPPGPGPDPDHGGGVARTRVCPPHHRGRPGPCSKQR